MKRKKTPRSPASPPRDANAAGAKVSKPEIIFWSLPLIVFAVSRSLYAWAGVRFDAGTINYYAQLLDPALLRNRLAQSLWYLHAQPPLYNALAGLALKIAPVHFAALLYALFLSFSLLNYYVLVALLVRLKLPRWWALGVVSACVVSPKYVAQETLFFYPQMVNCFLLAAAWALHRSGREINAWFGLALAAVVAVVMTRSIFHPLFFLLFIALLAVYRLRPRPARFLLFIALPMFVVMGWSLKNRVLFGFFGTSSWGGNSFEKNAGFFAGEFISPMIQRKELSPLAGVWQFSSGAVYKQVLQLDRDTGIPALDQTEKSTPSVNPVNYNHWTYPLVSKLYFKDALTLIKAHPECYWKTVRSSARLLVSADPSRAGSMARLEFLVPFFDLLDASAWSWLLCCSAMLAVLAHCCRRPSLSAEHLLYVFCFFAIGWGSLISILFEYGENSRMRTEFMNLTLILIVKGLHFGYLSIQGIAGSAAVSETEKKAKAR